MRAGRVGDVQGACKAATGPPGRVAAMKLATAGRMRPGRTVQPTDLGRVVSDRLRELERAGVSMKAVAARCDPPLSVSYLSRIGSGTIRTAGPEKLAAIATGLQLPLEALQAAQSRPPLDVAFPQFPCTSRVFSYAAPDLGPEERRGLDEQVSQFVREYLATLADRRR